MRFKRLKVSDILLIRPQDSVDLARSWSFYMINLNHILNRFDKKRTIRGCFPTIHVFVENVGFESYVVHIVKCFRIE
jgi:hypothetical protein